MLTETVAGRTYDYSHSVGRGSQTGMGFSNPVAAVIGKDETVYVVNRGSEGISNVAWNRTGYGARVSQIKLGATAGDEEFIGEFSKYGNGNGEFIWGSGVAIDSQDNLYVVDEWLNRVTVFASDGTFQRDWSTVGSDESGPNGTSGIAIDNEGNLLVTDGRSHTVKKFSPEGTLLSTWGKHGSAEGELDSPWGITVDHEGFIYIADFKNHRVQKFTQDGNFVAAFGSHGTKRGQLSYPNSVAVDPEGDVYVCDWSENGWEQGRVHIFEKDGRFLTSLTGDAQQLSLWAQMTVDANADYGKRRREVNSTEPEWRFAQPTAVMYDAKNSRVVVADTQRSRFQIYDKQATYMVPQLNL